MCVSGVSTAVWGGSRLVSSNGEEYLEWGGELRNEGRDNVLPSYGEIH